MLSSSPPSSVTLPSSCSFCDALSRKQHSTLHLIVVSVITAYVGTKKGPHQRQLSSSVLFWTSYAMIINYFPYTHAVCCRVQTPKLRPWSMCGEASFQRDDDGSSAILSDPYICTKTISNSINSLSDRMVSVSVSLCVLLNILMVLRRDSRRNNILRIY